MIAKSTKLLEARTGVEPVNKGFADLCLTTWLPRRNRSGFADNNGLLFAPYRAALAEVNICPYLPPGLVPRTSGITGSSSCDGYWRE